MLPHIQVYECIGYDEPSASLRNDYFSVCKDCPRNQTAVACYMFPILLHLGQDEIPAMLANAF